MGIFFNRKRIYLISSDQNQVDLTHDASKLATTSKRSHEENGKAAAAMIDHRRRKVTSAATLQPSVDEAASFVNNKWDEANEAGSFVYGKTPNKISRLTISTDREEIENFISKQSGRF